MTVYAPSVYLSPKCAIDAKLDNAAKVVELTEDSVAYPQETPYNNSPLDFDPFKKLIRIDIISYINRIPILPLRHESVGIISATYRSSSLYPRLGLDG